jgi:hypothetical protein
MTQSHEAVCALSKHAIEVWQVGLEQIKRLVYTSYLIFVFSFRIDLTNVTSILSHDYRGMHE